MNTSEFDCTLQVTEPSANTCQRAFTLIELLVVIAIMHVRASTTRAAFDPALWNINGGTGNDLVSFQKILGLLQP